MPRFQQQQNQKACQKGKGKKKNILKKQRLHWKYIKCDTDVEINDRGFKITITTPN